ncbi:Gfo/Idh/MocA family protein [Pseudactinotalea suaedae]|uniref:Gfo/Idh/MocA family protein n=1 Tax=Pseudactinotalea suaedae TaxID=1524924 RepID=UPI001390AED6|nr:Gfo/Idh/MocA family oxidoreductase [Pseudactinotalea suaedae]
MSRARVVVVGAGGIGVTAHLPAIAALPEECELIGVVDPDVERRTLAGEQFGCAAFADLDEALALSPDLVVLATPPHLHADGAVRSMRAGAWVYCEKPLTGSLAEADRIAQTEVETGRWCVTVSQFRYAGGSAQVRRHLHDGRWGRPLLGISHTTWYRGPEYWDAPWRGRYATEFGGSTTTQAYHAIDLLLWLMGGEWDRVSGVARTLERPIEVEDASVATIQFPGGGIGSIVTTVLSHEPATTVQVVASQATATLRSLYLPLLSEWSVSTTDAAGAPAPHPEFPEAEAEMSVNGHRAQLAELLAAWREGRQPELTTTESRRTLELITALYKSSATGRFVDRGEIVAGDPFYAALHGRAVQEVLA